MFNNVALDVFIGLVFIFLLYSLLATIIQEMIATRLAFRAKVLEKAISRMLEDGKTTTPLPYGDRIIGMMHLFGLNNMLTGKIVTPWFYAHPLIKYLSEDNYYSKPAYIDAKNFSKVMVDLLKGLNMDESQAVQRIHDSVSAGTFYTLPIDLNKDGADKSNPAIKELRKQYKSNSEEKVVPSVIQINKSTALFLRSLWQDSGADINVFRQKLESWFDDTMLRATGWYRRYTRIILFVIGLVVAVLFNVDTIAIHRILSKDKGAREQLVNMAISNQNKYAAAVAGTNTNTQLADSILRNTYNSVAGDAQTANSILGLGRPWSDTCKACDSIYGYANNTIIIDSTIESLAKIIADTNALTADRKRRIENTRTAMLQATALKNRCPYIRQQTENWFKYSDNQTGGAETLIGWLITAMAITLGAPFWFGLLSKLISLRGSGNAIDASEDKGDVSKPVPTPASSTAATNGVNVSVNTNPGEEAVG